MENRKGNVHNICDKLKALNTHPIHQPISHLEETIHLLVSKFPVIRLRLGIGDEVSERGVPVSWAFALTL